MLDEPSKAKIKWRCRRGMLELDLFFEKFLQRSLDNLSSDQVEKLMELLNYPDPELYAWFMGYETPEPEMLDLVQIIRAASNS